MRRLTKLCAKKADNAKAAIEMETKRAAITTATASDCRLQTAAGRRQTASCKLRMQTLSSTTLKPRSNGGYGNWASASATAIASASEHLHLPLELQQLLPVGAKWQVNKSHLQAIEWHQLPAAHEPPRIKSPTHSMMKLILSLLSLCALAAARPGFLHGHHHHYPEYPLYPHHHHHVEPLHVAKIVHLPAAVSHQSSTVVHSVPHHIIKPVILPTVVKTVVHPPIIKAYHPAPLIKAYHPYDPFHLHHHHHDFHDFHHY